MHLIYENNIPNKLIVSFDKTFSYLQDNEISFFNEYDLEKIITIIKSKDSNDVVILLTSNPQDVFFQELNDLLYDIEYIVKDNLNYQNWYVYWTSVTKELSEEIITSINSVYFSSNLPSITQRRVCEYLKFCCSFSDKKFHDIIINTPFNILQQEGKKILESYQDNVNKHKQTTLRYRNNSCFCVSDFNETAYQLLTDSYITIVYLCEVNLFKRKVKVRTFGDYLNGIFYKNSEIDYNSFTQCYVDIKDFFELIE